MHINVMTSLWYCINFQGFRGRSKNCYSLAVRRVQKALQYQYVSRRLKKRDMRSVSVWCMGYDVWYMGYDVWHGIWCVTYGIWCVTYGIWLLVTHFLSQQTFFSRCGLPELTLPPENTTSTTPPSCSRWQG